MGDFVEVQDIGGDETGNDKYNGRLSAGGAFTFPPFAQGAKDGTPERLWLGGGEQTTAKAKYGGSSLRSE